MLADFVAFDGDSVTAEIAGNYCVVGGDSKGSVTIGTLERFYSFRQFFFLLLECSDLVACALNSFRFLDILGRHDEMVWCFALAAVPLSVKVNKTYVITNSVDEQGFTFLVSAIGVFSGVTPHIPDEDII